MGANYRIQTGTAPRKDYGKRKLVPVKTNTTTERLYGKGVPTPQNDNIRDESLPRGWSILEPNRIKERRLAAGYATTDALSLEIDSISYQRLHKIENGVVVVRESEYELIAQTLGLPVSSLKLPMLMQSETIHWMEMFGPNKTIEEGGDHDAVILAAYVRYHANRIGLGPHQIAKKMGGPSNCMHFIWYAAKPIDRYPDSTMMVTMKMTKHDSWDKVIVGSQDAYHQGIITKFVELVRRPRVRYAPEDPSKKAPWTYDVDPFRTFKPRERFINAYTNRRSKEQDERLREMTLRRGDTRLRIRYYQEIKSIEREAKTMRDPIAMLADLFPDYRDIIEEGASLYYARVAYARVRVIDYLLKNNDLFVKPAALFLGVTSERIRQLKNKARAQGLVAVFPDHKRCEDGINTPQWNDYRYLSIKRNAA